MDLSDDIRWARVKNKIKSKQSGKTIEYSESDKVQIPEGVSIMSSFRIDSTTYEAYDFNSDGKIPEVLIEDRNATVKQFELLTPKSKQSQSMSYTRQPFASYSRSYHYWCQIHQAYLPDKNFDPNSIKSEIALCSTCLKETKKIIKRKAEPKEDTIKKTRLNPRVLTDNEQLYIKIANVYSAKYINTFVKRDIDNAKKALDMFTVDNIGQLLIQIAAGDIPRCKLHLLINSTAASPLAKKLKRVIVSDKSNDYEREVLETSEEAEKHLRVFKLYKEHINTIIELMNRKHCICIKKDTPINELLYKYNIVSENTPLYETISYVCLRNVSQLISDIIQFNFIGISLYPYYQSGKSEFELLLAQPDAFILWAHDFAIPSGQSKLITEYTKTVIIWNADMAPQQVWMDLLTFRKIYTFKIIVAGVFNGMYYPTVFDFIIPTYQVEQSADTRNGRNYHQHPRFPFSALKEFHDKNITCNDLILNIDDDNDKEITAVNKTRQFIATETTTYSHLARALRSAEYTFIVCTTKSIHAHVKQVILAHDNNIDQNTTPFTFYFLP